MELNYFIKEDYLKTNTPITQNVDVKDIIPFVQTSAEMYVQPYLGSFFYNYMLEKYNQETLSNDEFSLYKVIQPVVAWGAAVDAVYALTYQLKSKGVQTQSGENSEVAEADEVVMIEGKYAQKRAFYEQRLINYLRINKNLFPEFLDDRNNDCEIVDIKPTKNSGYNRDMLMI